MTEPYDNAIALKYVENMQPENKLVATFILKESENVTVMHCCLHNPNLSILASTRIQQDFFLKLSPKKETLLKCTADIRCFDKNRQQILIKMCKTRWLERSLAYEHFYFAFYCSLWKLWKL